jgi:hypothetical protein
VDSLELLLPLIKFGLCLCGVGVGIYLCQILAKIHRLLVRSNKLMDAAGFSLASIEKNTAELAAFYKSNDVKIER